MDAQALHNDRRGHDAENLQQSPARKEPFLNRFHLMLGHASIQHLKLNRR
jgi:hypothetical protein